MFNPASQSPALIPLWPTVLAKRALQQSGDLPCKTSQNPYICEQKQDSPIDVNLDKFFYPNLTNAKPTYTFDASHVCDADDGGVSCHAIQKISYLGHWW